MEGKEGEGRERKNLWICYPQQKFPSYATVWNCYVPDYWPCRMVTGPLCWLPPLPGRSQCGGA